MKASTFFGILFGLAAIFGAYYLDGGSFSALFMAAPLIIVIGGTLSAGLAGSSFGQIAKIPQLFAIAFNPPHWDKMQIIDKIFNLSKKSRKDGILALENELKNIEDPFLKKLIRICVDGADPEIFDEIVESEVSYISKRHSENIDLFVKLGGYSPTMGIIGTVMGLILTLSNAGSDPNELIKHIATAFVATMWGIMLANLLWLPMADKLRRIHKNELEIMQLMADGVRGLQVGENPSMIKSKLMSIFPIAEQDFSFVVPASKPVVTPEAQVPINEAK